MNFFKNIFFTSILLLALVSCKSIKYSLNGSTIPPEARSISVVYFQNQAALANPTLAQKFSEKLRDMMSSQTNLALKQSDGDLDFEGYISDYTIAPVAIQSGTDKAGLNRLTISVMVKYSNKFDKTKNFEQLFIRFSDFSASQSLSLLENSLMEEINRQLCEDIFNKAFNNW